MTPKGMHGLQGACGCSDGGRIDLPRADGVLDEFDRAIAEADVGATGMETAYRGDEFVGTGLCMIADRALGDVERRFLPDVDAVKRVEHRIAVVARGPPVPAIHVIGGEPTVTPFGEEKGIAGAVGDAGERNVAEVVDKPIHLLFAGCRIGRGLAVRLDDGVGLIHDEELARVGIP